MNYVTVCGLEVHVELSTDTKIFCACTTQFGGAPNTHTCPVCTGMPGTLPVLNKKVAEYAVKTGLALHCEINEVNRFDRKNYFYPDLPKAYQISQLYLPFCQNGYVEINDTVCGGKKKVHILEIHMEEDAGKLIHDDKANQTLINYNRCGVPLLEIVSAPEIATPKEAAEYVEKLRAVLQYCGVSDCKMQEGSLRVDVNVSVKKEDDAVLGTRTEMKNIGSLHAMQKAIEAEAKRQCAVLQNGGTVVQETRRWDEKKNESFVMRTKENAQDYKYFPEPDLPPLYFSKAYIECIRASLPLLPEERKEHYMRTYALSEYDAAMLCSDKAYADLFDITVEITHLPKDSANWIMGEVMRLVKETHTPPDSLPFDSASLSEVILLLQQQKISRDTAKEVFEAVFRENVSPTAYVKEHAMELLRDETAVQAVVAQVIEAYPKAVEEYRAGKEKALGFLIGQAMRALGGKASADLVKQALLKLL